MVIENPYNADWSWDGPNEPLDVPAKEEAVWYKPFIAEIAARQVDGETSGPSPQEQSTQPVG